MSHHSTFVTLFSSLYSLILHFLSIPTMANVNQWVNGRRHGCPDRTKLMLVRVGPECRPYPWNPKNGLKLNWSLDESQKQGWNNFGWVKKKSENNYGVQNIPMSYSSKIPETIFFGKMHAMLDKSLFTENFEFFPKNNLRKTLWCHDISCFHSRNFNLTPFGCFMTFWKYTRQVLDQYHTIPIY